MIRRRVARYETKTGHERWLVSYSDFITLLFAFFVMMYSISQVNEQKYQVLSATLAGAFDGKIAVDAEQLQQLEAAAAQELGSAEGVSPLASAPTTEELASQLQESLVHMANPKEISIRATEEWVEIEVNANLLFASAQADPSDEAKAIFRKMALVLASVPNSVEVSGHTDNIPIETVQFASNWELSSARASSVVRLLAQGGIDPQRLSAVGYGEFKPIADNQLEEGRTKNRRVVIKVARHVDPTLNQLSVRTFDPSDLAFGNESAEPSAQSTEPSAQSTEPSAEITEPSAEITEPSAEIGEPSVEITEPSAETFEPSATTAEPSPEAVDPSPETMDPIRLDSGGLLFSTDRQRAKED
jgi:chemotaxis protein MotB